jgi:two-component system, cell cycle sensor histidine kinase and response regulator CckA
MAESLRILILEDNAADAELNRFELEEAGLDFTTKVAANKEEYVQALQDDCPDLILSDYDLPNYNGALALAEAKKRCPDTPFILVTGAVGEDRAIEILTQGAKDYVLKSRLQQRLAPAVRRALAEAEEHKARRTAEAELREAHRTLEERVRIRTVELEAEMSERKRAVEALEVSEKRYRRLFESAKDGILILDADTGQVVDINPFLLRLLGYSFDALYGKYIWEIGLFKDIAASKEAFKTLQDHEYIRYEDLPLETLHGQPISVEFISNVYLVDHSKVIQCNIRDITERKRAEEALRESEERFRTIFEESPLGIVITAPSFAFEKANPAFCRMTGYSEEELCFLTFTDITHPDHIEQDRENVAKVGRGELPVYQTEKRYIRKDGTVMWGNLIVSAVRDEHGALRHYLSTIIDITERKNAEAEKANLQAQLLQSQKMESVGRLAGGVAHDFNNMLGVILGHAELALEKLDPGQPLHSDLRAIRNAAERSADLTRQLLAFARKQTVSPRILDINDTVSGMLKMLQRLIGEDIHLVWIPGAKLWPVKIDPSQIDQVLANLCVNARDAIAGVGKVTIETTNIAIDEVYCADHAGFVPGEYVLLAVSDNGCGMEKEILNKLFEPFFTTKETGKGTGLGLATVYGIVKQNNGFINVYSEPGQGTTFRIYLARYPGKSQKIQTEGATEPAMRGQETILLAEDEPEMLQLTATLLKRQGYTVLAACTPGEAIRMAGEHAGEIHLLITDVVMPEMNGRDLAKSLLSLYPNLKRLFMSGYTADVIAHHGVLDEGVHFIQKPFSRKDLSAKVREALDRK